MPEYEYKCDCGNEFTQFAEYKDSQNVICGKCHRIAKKQFSLPNLRTETSFAFAGIKDRRLGDEPIRDRKDFENRLQSRGLRIADKSDLED